MQRSKLEFICEKRLLFYGGGEVYQPQGNVEGATNERSKATKIVDDLLRGSTRARESDGKLLFDRIEDAKKFLGQSKDSASKDLLSKINTAKEGIITEQEYFERGEKNKNNHDHVRAYQKPWNDLFTHLRSAEELMKTAKESNSISASLLPRSFDSSDPICIVEFFSIFFSDLPLHFRGSWKIHP